MRDLWSGQCEKRARIFQSKPVGAGRMWTRRAGWKPGPRSGIQQGIQRPFHARAPFRPDGSRPGPLTITPSPSCMGIARKLIPHVGQPSSSQESRALQPDSRKFRQRQTGGAVSGSPTPRHWSSGFFASPPWGSPCNRGRPPPPHPGGPRSSGACACCPGPGPRIASGPPP